MTKSRNTAMPWIPVYYNNFLAETAHLNSTEGWAYSRLFYHYCNTGKLPNNDRALARLANTRIDKWHRIRPAIEPFFTISADGKHWHHEQLDIQLAKAERISIQRAAAAAKNTNLQRRERAIRERAETTLPIQANGTYKPIGKLHRTNN